MTHSWKNMLSALLLTTIAGTAAFAHGTDDDAGPSNGRKRTRDYVVKNEAGEEISISAEDCTQASVKLEEGTNVLVKIEEEEEVITAPQAKKSRLETHEDDADADTLFDQASAYLDGFGCTQNSEKAAQLFSKALTQGLDTNLTEIAIEKIQKLADKHVAIAMSSLGVYKIEARHGVEKDTPGGIELLRQAADKGDAKAMYSLGFYKIEARHGVEKDIPGGVELLRQASGKGHVFATNKLADLLRENKDNIAWLILKF